MAQGIGDSFLDDAEAGRLDVFGHGATDGDGESKIEPGRCCLSFDVRIHRGREAEVVEQRRAQLKGKSLDLFDGALHRGDAVPNPRGKVRVRDVA